MSSIANRYLLVLVAALIGAVPTAAGTDEVRELEWGELMPEGWDPFGPLRDLSQDELSRLVDGSEEADRLLREYRAALSSAPVVPELDGERVRLPGFVVPLSFEDTEVSEFLLVPYFGACIHVPPPPSNQIVYVKTEEPYEIEQLFDAVWVTGTLRTQAFLNEMGDAGYSLDATEVEPYQ